MDNISLLRQLNESTIKKSDLEMDLENALNESGIDLPPEEEMDDDPEMGGEEDCVDCGDEEMVDQDDEMEYDEEGGIEDEILNDIVQWCEDECGDLSDEELESELRSEIEGLIDPEELISKVMDRLGRGAEGEMDAEPEMGEDPEMVADDSEEDEVRF